MIYLLIKESILNLAFYAYGILQVSVLREWIDFSANKKSPHEGSFLLPLKESRKNLLNKFFLRRAGKVFLFMPFQSISMLSTG